MFLTITTTYSPASTRQLALSVLAGEEPED